MNGWSLIRSGLRYHWRSHLGVLLGATVATAILVGALAVGDSVKYSLQRMAGARIGSIGLALNTQSRFFRSKLAEELSRDLRTTIAPAIYMRGTAAKEDQFAGHVQVLGVDTSFWRLGPDNAINRPLGNWIMSEGVVLNDVLAAKLGAKVGEDVLLKVEKPSLLSRDAPLSTVEDAQLSIRLPVTHVVDASQFGQFSLESNQVPALSAFVGLSTLQSYLGQPMRANLLLVSSIYGDHSSVPNVTTALWKHWELTDTGLDLKMLHNTGQVEMKTDRVFLEPQVAQAALSAVKGAKGVLTYFVNELRLGDRATPYSTVAAVDLSADENETSKFINLNWIHEDNEILINQWLADDLKAKAGDQITLNYWIVGPMRKLTEQTATFKVKAVMPMEGPAVDRDFMPNIPGLTDKKNCRDWEPGVPIDLKKIRDKDQEYWTKYRGAPKAFISLAAGRKIWNNRFGDLTAVRYPTGAVDIAGTGACIRQALSPGSLGLFFAPVRERALAASSNSMDFGQLFLGFSFFLIIAALLLTALLFALGAESRAEETGILLALGFTPPRVRRLLLMEAAGIGVLAAVAGSFAGVLYTQAVIRGLRSVWSGAVASAPLQYHAETQTLAVGAAAGFAVSLLAIWFVARKQAAQPARELLSAGAESQVLFNSSTISAKRSRLRGLPLAIGSLGIALLMIGMAFTSGKEERSEYFFGAGAMLLIGGVVLARMLIAQVERRAGRLSIASLGARNNSRRAGRSISVVTLLACGAFLVVSVGAFRKGPLQDPTQRSSGTGGFALYGETALPVYQDLNTAEGRDAVSLDSSTLQGVSFLQFRVKEGDDASCLNLNRPQTPRVLGVNPDALSARNAFVFAGVGGKPSGSPWSLLSQPAKGGAVPVIADTNTVTWALGKSLGAVIDYPDEHGVIRKLQIVGVLGESVLQGALIISEANFTQMFPSQAGYQAFLIDAPPQSDPIRIELARGLRDNGLDLTPTVERLEAFNTVENTYLSIFAILGGLGLVLGSVGLGVIVLRNVLERRSELALMRGVGFTNSTLQRLLLSEHSLLLIAGIGIGVIAALIAVIPALSSPGGGMPVASLAITLLAVLTSGFVWVWLATALALRGKLLSALRNE